LFEQQVERTPDAVALVFKGAQLTYAALNNQANRIAHYLQSLGVGAEVFVGLCLERTFEMIAGLLGILKAGGVYVPLDPSYPENRLSFMIADAGISVLLTQEELAGIASGHRLDVARIDRDCERIGLHSSENLPTRSEAGSNAYLIYTSGSTGTPK